MVNLNITVQEIIQKYLQHLIPFLLCNMTGYDTIKKNYEDFIIKLNIYGCVGFEQYTASHLIEDYVTKNSTKGSLNADNWNVSY